MVGTIFYKIILIGKDMNLFIATSNMVKQKEYNAFGLPYSSKPGEDIKEPLTDIINIAVYKAQQAGHGAIVEDTALWVEGTEIGVLVRYLEHTLDKYDGADAIFQAALAVNTGTEVQVYLGETKGKIVRNLFPDAYGFDGNFIPENTDKTLFEIQKHGSFKEKAIYSPRARAVEEMMIKKNPIYVSHNPDKCEWDGLWQDDIIEYMKSNNKL